MNEHLNELEMWVKVNALIHKHGTSKKAAEWLGVSPQYFSDIIKSRREISDTVAKKLGYTKISIFVEVKWDKE